VFARGPTHYADDEVLRMGIIGMPSRVVRTITQTNLDCVALRPYAPDSGNALLRGKQVG
jgi:hypothetical protein